MTIDKPLQSQKLSRRDDFPERVKRVLRERVAGVCSNPDCRTPTYGPKGADKSFHIGHAAHICAAAPGGPRYDEHMTSEERRSFDNGIWVCSGCSPKIDGDPLSFPKELLREWKTIAEAKARKEQGRRPAIDDVKEMLQQALAAQNQKSLATSVSEAIYAQKRSLEALDSRFEVIPSWQHGVTSFELMPRETVNTRWQFETDRHPSYRVGLLSLIEHGRPFEFDVKHARVEGSPLLERLLATEGGKVVVTPGSIPASVQLVVKHPDLDITEVLVEVQGQLVHGTKSATFDGAGMGGCLKLSVPISLTGADRSSAITLGIDVSSWEGLPVSALPYLPKLLKIYQRLMRSPELRLVVEVNGQECWEASCGSQSHVEHIRETYRFLKIASAIRQLSMAFMPSIRWSFDKIDDMSPVGEILEAQAILNGVAALDVSAMPGSLGFTTTDPESFRTMKNFPSDKATDFMFVERTGKVLLLFGVPCRLPKQKIKIDCAFLAFKSGRRVSASEYSGTIQFKPGQDFSISKLFVG
ncbi:hypothetical protein [Pseudomonas sp. KCJK8751]|uniref:hypothetical protein n=1 Tax=Pseudomonas sp. KCJK8751 TaxID=3344564 RepID=UPI00390699E2